MPISLMQTQKTHYSVCLPAYVLVYSRVFFVLLSLEHALTVCV